MNSALSSRRARRCRPALEQLEDRLTPSWSGVPPTQITPPTSAAAVTLNASSFAAGSASITANENDFYTFIAPTTGSYTLNAATPSSSLDTVLGVFSAAGQRLAYNDDISWPSNTDSRVTLNLTAGARYYFGITNYTGSAGGGYSWQVQGPAAPTDDAYEENDSFAAARSLGTLTAAQTFSNLVLADANDWYAFTMNGPGTASNTVSISFLNSQGNLQLQLVNSAGTVLQSSSGTGNSETVSLSGRPAGTYYVRVYGASGAFNPNYSLTINPGVAPAAGGFQIDLQISGMTAAQQAIFRQAADRWAQVIVGDLPNATYNGVVVDDLLIHASAVSIDGPGGVLGQAGPDRFRSGSRLPYHGVMEFDTADLAQLQAQGTLLAVILHEMGHVLGIGTIWSDLGLLAGAGTSNPRFTGSQAVAAYNQIFGTNATAVPVENTGGAGTRDSHWRESVFGAELMTGYIGPGTNIPLSRVTVASLADLGYTVNMSAADAYTP